VRSSSSSSSSSTGLLHAAAAAETAAQALCLQLSCWALLQAVLGFLLAAAAATAVLGIGLGWPDVRG
jgi:hypothetical protein